MKKHLKALFILLLLLSLVSGSVKAVSAQKINFNVELDGAEKDLSLQSLGIRWAPDGDISYITLPNGVRRFFIGGDSKSYMLEVPSPLTLEQAVISNPIVKQILGPDRNILYRNGYSSLGQVLQLDNGNPYHVLGISQNEQWKQNEDGSLDYNNFTSSIGLYESFDGGETWQDKGILIRGDDYLEPGTRITGVGHPSAITKNGYIYIYFIDWASQTKVQHSDQIYLARIRINQDTSLGSVEYSTNNGFNTNPVNLKPAIPVPSVEASYAALPSVSYNKKLNLYLAIFETNIGFFQMVSRDAINWIRPKQILSFPTPQDKRTIETTWYSYPSLLSDNYENSDQTTQVNGNFYFSKGIWSSLNGHNLIKRSFSIR